MAPLNLDSARRSSDDTLTLNQKQGRVMAETAFVFTEDYFKFDYGSNHPMKISRLRLAYDLMKAYGLLDLGNCLYLTTRPATEQELIMFHRQGYLDALKLASVSSELADLAMYNMGPGDNPPFVGLYDWSLLTSGATIQCAELLDRGEVKIAFNMAGGLHHAHDNKASGFCYINDPVLGILALLNRGRRVVYIDVDAHHGDGVQWAFYKNKRALTVSFHQHGRTLFPGTGFVNEMGEDAGRGFSVNVPLMPGSDDEIYVEAFQSLVPELIDAFKPDVIVTQLGVDAFHTDPLANLDLTSNGFLKLIDTIKSLELPWLALGGGGYNTVNVARAWTLAWAQMNGVELDNLLPESVRATFHSHGYVARTLRDEAYSSYGEARRHAQREAQQAVSYIKNNIIPIIRGNAFS